ncbi:MAG: phosphoribosylformylglycinamidine synthase subunit PurS [Candidatus Methanomethylicia archaeon]
MPKFCVRVEVWLKDELVDAEGKTVEDALKDLGYNVDSMRVGKIYSFIINVDSIGEAKGIVEDICQRLLANPVKDKYFVSVSSYEVQCC